MERIRMRLPDGTIKEYVWMNNALLDVELIPEQRNPWWYRVVKIIPRKIRIPLRFLEKETVPTA